MEKEAFMRLWFLTFASLGGIAALATFDFKTGIITFAAAMVASVISWIYLNELWFKRKDKLQAKVKLWRWK